MSVSPPYQDLTIVVLAGGQSTRMGTDKGLLAIKNTNFGQQLISLATGLTPNVIVSVGKHNKEIYQNLDVITVLDKVPSKGPMGGIISVLPQIKSYWFLVLSVDTPLVTEEMIAMLWNAKGKFDSVVFSADNRIHPLIGLYHINTKNRWKKAFAKNELKVTKLVKSYALNILYPGKEMTDKLKNINTPKEYQELIK